MLLRGERCRVLRVVGAFEPWFSLNLWFAYVPREICFLTFSPFAVHYLVFHSKLILCFID